ARQINNNMGGFVADAAIRQMILAGINVRYAKVAVYGITFKEDCNDIRNSKVVDIINRLKEFGVDPLVTDPMADPEEVLKEYGVELADADEIADMDCIIFAVAHSGFREMSMQEVRALYGDREPRVLIDVKGMFKRSQLMDEGYCYWRL
ncbi:MAG TPA: UDP binding domain-containing protein, partial [Clostridia bacterium]|nr:UDP binding domain-containing protein [Clostridia bacterium]